MRLGNILFWCIGIIGLTSSFSTFARPYRELIVGPEWEFSNEQGRSSDSQEQYGGDIEEGLLGRIVAHVLSLSQKYPGDLKTDKVGRDVYFDLPHGSWILFGSDPGVVEVHSSPRTIKEYKRDYPLLQKYVFRAAKSVGLDYSWDHEAAHIHFDFTSGFGVGEGQYDYLHFRNFVVDFYNHSEIYLGILDDDSFNAPGLGMAQRKKLASLFKKFERGLGADEWRAVAGEKLAPLINSINTLVYKNPHYAALNLENAIIGKRKFKMNKTGTFEVRSVAMRSLKEWLKVAEIFEARVNFLAEKENLLALRKTEERPTPRAAILNFEKYVSEAGLSWEKYQSVMAEPFQQALTCASALDSN